MALLFILDRIARLFTYAPVHPPLDPKTQSWENDKRLTDSLGTLTHSSESGGVKTIAFW